TFMSHFDGVEGSTNIVDQSKYNHPITVLGNAHITTSNFKFGSSSLALDGSGNWLRVPYHEGFDFGEGDWTVEAWVRGEELWIGGIILARYTVSQRSWFLRLTD